MDNVQLAILIIKHVGGEANVVTVTHCATRLRFNLKDEAKVNEAALKKVKGVIGVVYSGGQFQVVIGNDVGSVYKEIIKSGHFQKETANSGEGQKSVGAKILDTIAGVFTPILPTIVGAGMLKAFLALLLEFQLIKTDSQNYYILNFISDAGFFFLPIFLAYTSAIKFKCNPFMAMSLAGVLLHPSFATLVDAHRPVEFFGLPVGMVSYGSSVIPIILSVWAMSYVEEFADKFSPNPVKFFSKPLITLLVMAPVALIAIGPLGTFIGNFIAMGVMAVNTNFGWLVALLMGAFSPLLVMTGMHYSLFPVVIPQMMALGYDTILGPGMLAANIAQGAAALCVAYKTKNSDLKQLASSSGFTALMGITEPAMYGVNLKLKKPFIGVMIGGGISGLYAGIVALKMYAPASPGLASLPTFIGPGNNFINAIITIIISFVATFFATWFLGFEDPVDENKEETAVEAPKQQPLSQQINIASPITGQVISLSQVNDPTFAQEIMGKGIAVMPTQGKVVSPVKGTVAVLFETKHAIALISDDGAEILIHIGLNTVELSGKYFTSHVKAGDTINVGDLLVEFDMDAIKAAGYDLITPMIITNTAKYLNVLPKDIKEVQAGQIALTIA